MTPLEVSIRQLEHECGVGVPHEACWTCGTGTWHTPAYTKAESVAKGEHRRAVQRRVAERAR